MVKWFTALVLVIALAGSALAGFPLHSGEHQSEMMSCCKEARAQDYTPSAAAARLCCAVNCSQPGPTAPTSTVRNSPLTIVPLHPANIQSPLIVPGINLRLRWTQVHSTDSQPTYIRHLALLI
jgi:hypothetical protein